MDKKNEIRWGMGWQGSSESPIEDVLRVAVECFLKKWFVLPDFIYVNPNVDLKTYGNIQLKRDKQMFSRGMLLMMLPTTIEIEK